MDGMTEFDLREEIMEIYGLPDVLRESWRAIWRGTPLWMAQDWIVQADGFRLVIENGAMVGLAYDEFPWPWDDPRYQQPAAPPHKCSDECVCPRDGKPLIYWPAGDDHACQDSSCYYGHGMRAVDPFPESRVLAPGELAGQTVSEPPPGLPYKYFGMAEPSITCPVCGMTSHNPNDAREGYCGNCHDWTGARR
jgi:hypothetical protein